MEDEKDLMKQPDELEALKKRIADLEKKNTELERQCSKIAELEKKFTEISKSLHNLWKTSGNAAFPGVRLR